MCHFAVPDLAWDLLHDDDAGSDVRRKSGILSLAFALTGNTFGPKMSVIRPLLAPASGEDSEAATQLMLVRMILRKQNWQRTLRLEVRTLLTSLSRSWLQRDVDLTAARSARCIHLSDEILAVMREAGVTRQAPSPWNDGTCLNSWEVDDDLVLESLLPIGSAITKSKADEPEDPVGKFRPAKIEGARPLLIAEHLLEKHLTGQPSGEPDRFALACLWWTTVVSVEFAMEEVEKEDDGSIAFASRLMSAAFVLGMSLGLDWNRLEPSAVRRLIAAPPEHMGDTSVQMFLVRVLLRDEKWWQSLQTEIRALLEELWLFWMGSPRDLGKSSRRTCLALCEKLLAKQQELNYPGYCSEPILTNNLPEQSSVEEA